MIISLLTDYGIADEFVGVCHGVIADAAPDARVIDVTHGIRRHDVRHGALVLRNALPYLPVGVHVAVVDPQVGTERRAVAMRCADERILIGPDNGVLSLAWERAGGVEEAVEITRSPFRLEPVSATFHGRDVFAPVAARIAAGGHLREAGEPLELDKLAVLELPQPQIADGVAAGHALLVDGYGNISLDLTHEHMLALDLTLGARVDVNGREATVVQTFADVGAGELLVYEDAWGAVALAVNRGNAAAELGVERDAEVRVARR